MGLRLGSPFAGQHGDSGAVSHVTAAGGGQTRRQATAAAVAEGQKSKSAREAAPLRALA